ncbi:MAG: hypothetical protein E7520_00065 [Ruminococcaceae bacterium]|jgi:hypothetical protein|nr:hypothetical protein [Oscillospiraceae bacterium]
MLHTVISFDDVFYQENSNHNAVVRSTNPYDYIRKGWFLDNSVMYRGVNHVNLKFDYSGNFTIGV